MLPCFHLKLLWLQREQSVCLGSYSIDALQFSDYFALIVYLQFGLFYKIFGNLLVYRFFNATAAQLTTVPETTVRFDSFL